MPGRCLEIRVYGLCKTAVDLLDATTAALDLSVGQSLNLTKEVEQLSDVNKIATEGALGFSVPFCFTNDSIFVDSASPLELDRERVYYDVAVTIDGHPYPLNRLSVVEKDNAGQQWNLQLFRAADFWADLATQKKLNDISIGTFFLTKNNVSETWENPAYSGDFSPTVEPGTGLNLASYWPLLDFGNFVDQTTKPQNGENDRYKSVSTEDFRPLISVVYLLKRGFCEIGWTLDGVIFETEFVRRLWAYLLRPDFYIGSGNGYKYGRSGRIIGRYYGTGYTLAPGTPKLTFSDLEFAVGTTPLQHNGGPNYRLGIKSVLPFISKYRFILKANIRNDNPTPVVMVFYVAELSATDTNNNFETGEVLSPDFLVEISAGETKFAIVEIEALVGENQKAAIAWGNPGFTNIVIEGGLYFEVEPNNKSYTRADYVDLQQDINPDYTLLDLFKGFIHLVRGKTETDNETKTVTVHTSQTTDVWGETVPGFLRVESPATDISNKIIFNSIKEIPKRKLLKRYTRLEFKDTTDAFIESLNLTEPLHSRTILNGVDLPDETASLPNPFFEPTVEGQMRFIKQQGRELLPVVPRLWDNLNDEISFNIGPRILFAFGSIRQLWPTPITPAQTYCGWFWDGKDDSPPTDNFEQYLGYATQLRTFEVEPTPSMDANVVFGREAFDLFVNFYLGLTNESRGGTILDALVKMSANDYFKTNFRDMYRFVYNGRPYRVPMTSIRDFATCNDSPTPVQFFVDPSTSTCCDIPCGCRFTTCEYYMDFGITIQQSTVDDMAITSFKVDDVELLESPVGLGLIEIIDLSGYPYFANIVDVLNSIGAPYFIFKYSTRLDASDRARFFFVKHPACQSFEIVISENGEPLYYYSNTQQGVYSGETLGPLGYAGEYALPIDCQTTTEY